MNLWAGAGAVQNGFEMAKVLAQIRRMRDNSLSVRNRVLYLSDFIHPENTYRNSNMGLWEILMEEGKENRRYVPCVFKKEDVRDRLAIILANRFRDKTDWEK